MPGNGGSSTGTGGTRKVRRRRRTTTGVQHLSTPRMGNGTGIQAGAVNAYNALVSQGFLKGADRNEAIALIHGGWTGQFPEL